MIQAEDVLSYAGSQMKEPGWFAMYTKGRHEKLLNRELNKKGLETFLPLRKIIRHWSDRKKVIEEPLFKSYLFVRMKKQDFLKALSSPGAVRFVTGSNREPVLVPENEIETIRRVSSCDMPLDPFPYLNKGDRVYIKSGPLKGVEGFVVFKNQQCRLVLSIDALMHSVSVEVDGACIEKAG